MTNNNNYKQKFIELVKLLLYKTDKKHQITIDEILDELTLNNDSSSHKTVKKDLDLLIDSGLNIKKVIGRPNKYYMENRIFEPAELKVIIDSIEFSQFITPTKTEELIEKITKLLSCYQTENIKSNLQIINPLKQVNEQIYKSVELINEAINKKRKITFNYFDYSPEKERIYKNNRELYKISPYILIWNDERYYVLGYSDKRNKIVTFRVDRIANARISMDSAVKMDKEFDPSQYIKQNFKMYSGKTKTVELLCRNIHMKSVIDRFGEDVNIVRNFPDSFLIKVNVGITNTFFAWLSQFDGGIIIKSPIEVKKQYRTLLLDLLSEELR